MRGRGCVPCAAQAERERLVLAFGGLPTRLLTRRPLTGLLDLAGQTRALGWWGGG
jgi:hypothetical protein